MDPHAAARDADAVAGGRHDPREAHVRPPLLGGGPGHRTLRSDCGRGTALQAVTKALLTCYSICTYVFLPIIGGVVALLQRRGKRRVTKSKRGDHVLVHSRVVLAHRVPPHARGLPVGEAEQGHGAEPGRLPAHARREGRRGAQREGAPLVSAASNQKDEESLRSSATNKSKSRGKPQVWCSPDITFGAAFLSCATCT